MVKYDPFVAQDFIYEVANWKLYCNSVLSCDYSLNALSFQQCEPFRNLFDMGVEILPYVHQGVSNPVIGAFPLFGWSALVREIVGDTNYVVPSEIKGKLHPIRLYVKNWLEQEGNVLDETLDVKIFREKLQDIYDLVDITYDI
ncbi:hypothetical protein HQ489_02525 [Candidatus Woesearchaeota archaeon]|nr:hypothetical protein [Candidatus Woesearchaeota archaeon]